MQMQATETATAKMQQVLEKLAHIDMDAAGQSLVASAQRLLKDRAIVPTRLDGALVTNLAAFEHLDIITKDGPTEDQADDYAGFIHLASMVG